jgi:hypothetical protein
VVVAGFTTIRRVGGKQELRRGVFAHLKCPVHYAVFWLRQKIGSSNASKYLRERQGMPHLVIVSMIQEYHM